MEELAALKKEYAQLETELAAYGACDPEKIEEKKRALVLAKEAAVRWTGESLAVCFVSKTSGFLTLNTQTIMLCYCPTSHDRTPSRRLTSGPSLV